jgi:hypothetical protein
MARTHANGWMPFVRDLTHRYWSIFTAAIGGPDQRMLAGIRRCLGASVP